MKKWQLGIFGFTAILLIACNFFLILRDNSKIERTAYVEKWDKIGKGDLKESLKTEGVVTSSEEHYIYFNEEIGSFNQFLVKEGDSIKKGDPLFEYESFNVDRDKQALEDELDKVEDQIDSIEDHIDELGSFISVIEAKNTSVMTAEDDDSVKNIYSSVVDVEKEIYNKELEKVLLEKEAELLEKQIGNIDEQSSRLKVASDFEGTVTKINTKLGNPIVVIQSNIPAVKGQLDEKEVNIVETGMPAFIYPSSSNKKINGFVTRVQTYPEDEPSIKKESFFPFFIELEGENKELYSGTHTALTIITNEVKDTVIVPEDAVKKKYKKTNVFVITQDGKLQKQKVELGINVHKKQEIKEGLEGNEILAISPSFPKQVKKADFITPIKTREFSKKSIKSLTRKEMLKYTFTGFIRR
jgi:HlyD family secretion protein